MSAALRSTTTTSAAARTGSVSPAGEPFATLPPRVPRFWICTPPISRAAATSIGRRFCTSGDRLMPVKVASAPIDRTSPRISIRRMESSGQRFRNRVSLSVPKFSATYKSVQPAIGTSGPSSRSMLSASVSDLGWNN